MGKKRIVKKGDTGATEAAATNALKKKFKNKISLGNVYINSTYNNTLITFTDPSGAVIFWGSAGALGFNGAKKGTPYAASKVAEMLSEKAKAVGMEEAAVYVRGVGAGRESAIRSIANNGIAINFIKDITPVPFNGPKARKVRRV